KHSLRSVLLFCLLRPPPLPTLFPYTTLFRSGHPTRRCWRASPPPGARSPPTTSEPPWRARGGAELYCYTARVLGCVLAVRRWAGPLRLRSHLHRRGQTDAQGAVSPYGRELSMFFRLGQEFGVDLGTATVLIYVKGQGSLLR